MSKNPQLGYTELEGGQAQPEVPVNAADRFASQLVAGQINIEFTSDANRNLAAPNPLTTSAEWPYAVIRMTDSVGPTLTAARDVIYPDVDTLYGGPSRQMFTFINDTARTLTIKRAGQTGVAVPAGQVRLVRHNGTDIVEVAAAAGGGSDAEDVSYDPSTASGLSSTNVQDALDELGSGGGGGGGAGDIGTEILADAPTAYWPCNETSGSTIDDAATGAQDLTVAGTIDLAHTLMIAHSTDKFLRVRSGSGNRLSRSGFTGTSPSTGDWTQECIVMLQGSGTSWRLLGFNQSGGSIVLAWIVVSTGELQTLWNASPVQTTSPIFLSTGLAYHLAIVKDGTANTITFYLNGRKVGAVSYSTEPNLSGSGGTLFVGATPAGTSTGAFVIGHLAYYDGVKLSDARIMAHAHAAGLA